MYKTLISALSLLLLLLTQPVFAEEDFLPVDEAFHPSISNEDPLTVSFKITDKYYLYRSKFKFTTDDENISIGTPEMPASKTKEDEFFGKLEVYYHQADIKLPVTVNGSQESFQLNVKYQGCADAGLCYPPQRKTFTVKLPKTTPVITLDKPKTNNLSALSSIGDTLGLNNDDDEILHPDQAYLVDTQVIDGKNLNINWTIADGTYLYYDKVAVKLLKGDGVQIAKIDLPPPDIKKDTIKPDCTIGDVSIYHGNVSTPITLNRSNTGAVTAQLEVKYQGCADRGICYPPQKKVFDISLPAVTSSDAPIASMPVTNMPHNMPDMPLSEQDEITALLSGGNSLLIVAAFFGFGLLLAFTPCIFPMIPILSGIIAGQGTNITARKGFILSLVYVVAMATTYTIAGVIAGIFGANIQVAFQNPWVLSIFAGVFVLLAFSMFGFYELQLPSSWQSKLTSVSNQQKGGNLVGVAIMGLLSALIVGPCVAPPLAGALIYIGQSQDPVLGGMALFAMGMGMGAPLLLLGLSAGKLLPRAGAWMDGIKAFFGVSMLAVAIILLERIIPTVAALFLWSLLLICSSVYLGLFNPVTDTTTGWQKLRKGFAIVSLVYGIMMLIGVAINGHDTVQPFRGMMSAGISSGGGPGTPSHLTFTQVKGTNGLDKAVAAASANGQMVMLDFYADWCISCKEMERYTFNDPTVMNALSNFKVLQADVTDNDDIDIALQKRFKIVGPPAILFFDKSGKELKHLRVVGFMDAEKFTQQVNKASQ